MPHSTVMLHANEELFLFYALAFVFSDVSKQFHFPLCMFLKKREKLKKKKYFNQMELKKNTWSVEKEIFNASIF